MDMPERLQSYIDQEASGAAAYRRLADMANDITASEMLLEIAEDKAKQAEGLKEVYRLLTGQTYDPAEGIPALGRSFKSALLDRVMEESEEAALYGKEAYIGSQNEQMKKIFHEAAERETFHTLKLLHLVQRT